MANDTASIQVFDFRSDAILFYNVGKWGERGYGHPHPGANTVTINSEISKFIRDGGRLVSVVMHRPDIYLTKAPSLNAIKEMVQFVNRARAVIASRSIPENEERPEMTNVQSPREPLVVFPCPYHNVVNPLMREFAKTAFMCMSELMQDGNNVFAYGIAEELAKRALSHVFEFQKNMATEYFFGLTPDLVNSPTLNLIEHLDKYQPSKVGYIDAGQFDTPGAIEYSSPQPEDLGILRRGVIVSELPPEARNPYPYGDIKASEPGNSGTTSTGQSFDIST